MSLNNPLGKDSGVLSIEEQVDSSQLDVLLSTVPVTDEFLCRNFIRANEDWAPETAAIFIFAETFTWNRLEGSICVGTIRDPLFWQSAVVLGVVKGLKR